VILPNLILPSRINQCWEYSGLDSPEHCQDKKHFKKYPHTILYQYNSRGFRDQEWPESTEELKNSIWCLGDSFTVGLGSPLEHTWPWLLQKQTGRRVINVSMDGASNNWIARRAKLIQNIINPKNIVIMWSYLHRREHNNHMLDDESRRLIHSECYNDQDDLVNFKSCIDLIKNNNVIQLFIPDHKLDIHWKKIRGTLWPLNCPNTLDELFALPESVQRELKDHFKVWTSIETSIINQTPFLENNIIKVNQLDLSRDGHHFDLITAQWVVDQIIAGLQQN